MPKEAYEKLPWMAEHHHGEDLSCSSSAHQRVSLFRERSSVYIVHTPSIGMVLAPFLEDAEFNAIYGTKAKWLFAVLSRCWRVSRTVFFWRTDMRSKYNRGPD
jgi:hypothetical protein